MSDATEVVIPKLDGNGTPVRSLEMLRAKASEPVTFKLSDRLAALNELSDQLLRGAVTTGVAGNAFLAAFLRQSNLEALLRRELPNIEAIDQFVHVEPRKSLRLLPRGVVCHWIAGNVPLLGAFGWATSSLLGNVNVIRLSSRQADHLSPLLDYLSSSSPAGEEMVSRTVVMAFERNHVAAHEAMSLLADVRIAWGGKETIEAIRGLPCGWDCEDVIMGPRVSYAVVDPLVAEGRVLERLVTDIVYFDQLACSSPQIVFAKGQEGEPLFDRFLAAFEETFAQQALKFPRHALDFAETYQIHLDRTRTLLTGNNLRRDAQTQWTMAVLRAPIKSLTCANRFVQIAPYDRLDEIYPYLAPNTQTILTVLEPHEFEDFTENASQRGACRFPLPGEGNHFETPWDGIPFVSRLCRWVTRSDPRQPSN
jgi:hypothetical protein